MKLSLNVKLFIAVSLLLIFIVLVVILLNTTILEKYYRHEKEKDLISLYKEAYTYYQSDDALFDTTSDFLLHLQKIDSTKNIEIVLCDLENNVFFTSSNNFLKNGFFIPNGVDTGFSEFSFSQIYSSLNDKTPYLMKTFYDKRLNSNFTTLYGKLSADYLIFLRTPIESIHESVQISNKFLCLVGVFCIISSSIITFIIAKAFTKPILELNEIAQRMSNLDFSKKYEVTTDDEIGTLGRSINKLSENLEKTISDLKEANIDLEKDVEEKSKLSEMRNQFISDVSHELKTPIALIQGYAEGLNDGIVKDEEDKKYYIEVILDEANKMSNLTKDLLDLSRLEYGKEELHIQEFNITELAKQTLKKNEVLFKEKNISCSFNSDADYMAKADSSRIEQVLTNYISNAIKNISGNNIIKCDIVLTSEGKIRVSIYNSGKHINEEDIPRLWTRFYKGDSSRNREVGGTGIGLSLVKAIMNQHKNKYGVQNIEDGVEFWFEVDKV